MFDPNLEAANINGVCYCTNCCISVLHSDPDAVNKENSSKQQHKQNSKTRISCWGGLWANSNQTTSTAKNNVVIKPEQSRNRDQLGSETNKAGKPNLSHTEMSKHEAGQENNWTMSWGLTVSV